MSFEGEEWAQLPLHKQAIKYHCIGHDRSCDLGQIWLTELKLLMVLAWQHYKILTFELWCSLIRIPQVKNVLVANPATTYDMYIPTKHGHQVSSVKGSLRLSPLIDIMLDHTNLVTPCIHASLALWWFVINLDNDVIMLYAMYLQLPIFLICHKRVIGFCNHFAA